MQVRAPVLQQKQMRGACYYCSMSEESAVHSPAATSRARLLSYFFFVLLCLRFLLRFMNSEHEAESLVSLFVKWLAVFEALEFLAPWFVDDDKLV